MGSSRYFEAKLVQFLAFFLQENIPKSGNRHILGEGGLAGQKTKFKILI